MEVAGKAFAAIDPLLEPLVASVGDDQANSFLSDLISTHAAPLIEKIIRYKLHLTRENPDSDDLRQEAVAQLLVELRKLRERPDSHPIGDLRGLAAVIAHRTCSAWLRRQFPRRHSLKNRLYYVLTRNPRLALWQDQNATWIAGLPAWKAQSTPPARGRPELSDEALAAPIQRFLAGGRFEEVASALIALFTNLKAPVEFDQLVSALAALCPSDAPIQDIGRQPAPDPDPAWRAEKRIFLQRLWQEVQRLPRHQRVALLLNLRDTDASDCIMIFPSSGIGGCTRDSR